MLDAVTNTINPCIDVDDRHNPKLIQILHSCGIVLIDICRFTPSYQVHIIKEKLASKLLTALEKFNEHENPSEVSIFL